MLIALLLASLQDPESHVLAGDAVLYHGYHLDLDARTVSTKQDGADLRFVAEGVRGWIIPSNGTLVALLDGTDPLAITDLAGQTIDRTDRIPIRKGETVLLAVRTSNRRLAVVRGELPQAEDAHFAAFSYRCRTAEGTALPPPPTDATIAFVKGDARIRWTGDGPFTVWLDGARSLEPETAECTISRKDTAVRVRIARRLGKSAWSQAAELTISFAPIGVVTGSAAVDDYRTQGSFSFLKEVEPLTLYRDGFGMSAPGGIAYVGNGEEKFRELKRVPRYGYVPEHRRAEAGDVFVVRLTDGRFAKAILTQGQWYRHHFYYELLAQGGLEFPTAPALTRTSYENGSLKLKIHAASGARYRIHRVTPERRLVRLAETTDPFFDDREARPNQLYSYALTVADEEGRETAPFYLDTDTFPKWWRKGFVTLSTRGEGFAFDEGKAVGERMGDFYIAGSAGGASSLSIRLPNGGWGSESRLDTPFGELGRFDFDTVNRRLSLNEIHTDDRRPETEVFWLRTAAGSLAQLRIVSRDYPKVTFEYIVIPRQPPWETVLADLRVRAKAPNDEVTQAIRGLLDELDAEELDARDAAAQKLVEKGDLALHGLIAAFDGRTDSELRTRIQDILTRIYLKKR